MSLGVILLILPPQMYFCTCLQCSGAGYRVLAWLDAAVENLSYLAVSSLLLLTFFCRETGKMNECESVRNKEVDKERREERDWMGEREGEED